MTINGQFQTILDYIVSIATHYFYDGRLTDAVNILEQGTVLAAYNDVPQEAQFDVLLSYGSMLSQQAWLETGDYDSANEVAKQLEELVVTPSQNGRLLGLQGNILRQQALSATDPDFETPRKLFEESLAQLDEETEAQAYFWSLFRMGICDQFMGQYNSAMQIFQRADAIARAHDFKHEISYSIRHIGFVYQFTDRLDQALAALQESLALRKELNFRIFLGLSHLAVANVLHQLSKQNEAKTHYELAILHCEEVGFSRSMMITYFNYGQALFEYRNLDRSQLFLLKAIVIAKEIGHAGVLKAANELLDKIYEPS